MAVKDGGDAVSLILEAARHVGAHATDSDDCDGFFAHDVVLVVR
jgi:hypothetical protein